MTYLTVPISARDITQAKQQISSAKAAGAELLELRTDYLDGLNIELAKEMLAAANQAALPIVVTCRDSNEGGANNYPADLRSAILAMAAKNGAEFIDCEFENFKNAGFARPIKNVLSENGKTKLILSAHSFDKKFNNVKNQYLKIALSFPQAIAKLAYKAEHINDCFEAFDLMAENKGSIVICMGAAGVITRILAKKLGSALTFACLDDENSTAPGQITVGQLKNLYHFDSINEQTELFGIIADPVGHSISPAVHNRCFDACNLNKLYLPLLVGDGKLEFDEFMKNVMAREWLNFKGFSVTIPHKGDALEFVRNSGNFVEPLAAKIGAVNTITIGTGNRISAYNTDYAGALDGLTNTMGITRKHLHDVKCAVIGAGGAARAITAGLTDFGAKVTIYNRTESKAANLAAEFGARHEPINAIADTDARIIINCTSIGMYPNIDATPVPAEVLNSNMVVFDTVYNPAETKLLADTKKVGAKTVGGVEMFIGQAAEQFKHFTGQMCDENIMRQAVNAAMNL